MHLKRTSDVASRVQKQSFRAAITLRAKQEVALKL